MASSDLILFEVPTIQIRLTGKVSNARGILIVQLKQKTLMNHEKTNYRYYFKDDATYVADLEFAARIGKILLEQNKELEDHSKLLQEKIADQDAKILVKFWFLNFAVSLWFRVIEYGMLYCMGIHISISKKQFKFWY